MSRGVQSLDFRLPAEERGSRARGSSAYRTWQQAGVRGTTCTWTGFREIKWMVDREGSKF